MKWKWVTRIFNAVALAALEVTQLVNDNKDETIKAVEKSIAKVKSHGNVAIKSIETVNSYGYTAIIIFAIIAFALVFQSLFLVYLKYKRGLKNKYTSPA